MANDISTVAPRRYREAEVLEGLEGVGLISKHDDTWGRVVASERSSRSPAAQAVPRFTQASRSNLNGKAFNLPHDFEGDTNLVLLAFWKEQQRTVDTWVPFAEGLSERYESFRYYELGVLSRVNSFARAFIDGGMRAGIPDERVRARTLTLYLDKATLLKPLVISDQSTIHTLLVTRDGEVLWQERGGFTSKKGRALLEVFEQRLISMSEASERKPS